MMYIASLITITIIIIASIYQLNEFQLYLSPSQLTLDKFLIPYKLKKDCQADKVYCFIDNDCFHKCTVFPKIEFTCQYGTCKVSPESLPLHECNLANGVTPYLIGIPEIGSVDWICKPVDLGIIKYNKKENKYDNLMCKGGEITNSIDYNDHYPNQSECKCPDDKFVAIVPATELKRLHVECVDRTKFNWVYESNGLIYHHENKY